MIGINRWDEPFLDKDPTVPETMNNVFEYINNSGLSLPELKQVFRDYDSYYHGDMRKPDYVDEAAMSKARDLEWEGCY